MTKDDNLPRYLRPPAGKILNRWGRQFWKDNAGDLYRADLLKETDIASFIMLCQAYGLAMESATKIGEEGLFRQDENNITRKHPATQVHRDSVAMFNRLADKFALNPKARQTMKIASDEDDIFTAYLMSNPRLRSEKKSLLDMSDAEYEAYTNRRR